MNTTRQEIVQTRRGKQTSKNKRSRTTSFETVEQHKIKHDENIYKIKTFEHIEIKRKSNRPTS